MFSSLKKKHTPSNSAPANRLASQSRAGTQQPQIPPKSQSQSHPQSSQQKQPSQPVCPWSVYDPPSGPSPSPFPRRSHTLSATTAGELFLFGGYAHGFRSNDLYVFSTRDFSTTLLQASGEAPSPRAGHSSTLTSSHLLIWGGNTYQGYDDSFYLLNLVSREWTRVMVNGPRPSGRDYHTVSLVGSKLFVFGGYSGRPLNDMWAFDLSCLNSNPRWEIYERSPGDRRPLPRGKHVSVATGDCIIIFGGSDGQHLYNDTWLFDISTRKWTELQCTGSIPSPRTSHTAVLVDDVMYVFGGFARDSTVSDDLTAFNLSTQQWIAFQDIGPSPSGRWGHGMASDGTRIFVLGGTLSVRAKADQDKLIHVLDTKKIKYPEPDFTPVNPSERITQLVRKSSAGPPTQGQTQQPTTSLLDAHAVLGASPFQHATPEELDRPTSPRITRERNPSPNDLPSQPPGVDDKLGRVAAEGDNSEGSTKHHAKLVVPGASSEEVVARSEDERLTEVERQLSATLAAQTVRDWRIAQLTGELAQNSALLKQTEANAVEANKRAELELRELRTKLDELLLSRDHVLEQAQSALQKATSHAADAIERSQREFAEVRAELEARKSEWAAVHLRLTDAENGWAKCKAEVDTLRAQTAANLVNTDEGRVMHRLMERVRAMEAEMVSPRWNDKSDKSFEMMECRNED